MAALEWLGEQGFLSPEPQSPLAFLRQQESRIGSPDRHAAGADLLRRGLVSASWSPEVRRRRLLDSGPLGASLKILERPEARLRIGIGAPESPVRITDLYLAGGEAVLGALDDEALYLGATIPRDRLIDYLVDELAASGDSDAFCLWPMLYRLTTALWPSCGREPRAEISIDDIEARAPGQSASLVEQMLAADLVARRGDRLALTDHHRRWLEPLWSGHVFEIERTPMEPWNGGREDRCLFVGSPGERVLCEEVPSHQLLGDGHAGFPEDHLLLLTCPGRSELTARLAQLLDDCSPVPASLSVQ